MIRLTEGALFLSLATGLHLGLWATVPGSNTAQQTAPHSTASLAVVPADTALNALVRDWQTPPSTTQHVQTALPVPGRPDAPTAPVFDSPIPQSRMPDRPALPQAHAAPDIQDPPQQPQLERSAPELAKPLANQTAPRLSPRPAVRPARTSPPRLSEPRRAEAPKPNSASATPQPVSKPKPQAQAKPKAQAKAPAETAQAGATSAARAKSLQAGWGAKIQSRVHRNLRYPRGETATGTARVALTILRNGQLAGAKLVRSSGHAALDRAALAAVNRAGRFPKAPSELAQASYSFTIALTFTR